MVQEQRAVIKMPELTGLPLRKAKLLVENCGLRVDEVLFAESYDERNTVLAQKPARGQMVYVGDKATITVSRESYAKWLPSIYQRSDVTGRNFVRDLLWITQHLFGSVEDTLDVIHTYFDPLESPDEFLPWLASWTAMVLEEDWPIAKKRKLVKEAVPLYRLRGTVKGLKLFISLFTGHEPEIVENAWPYLGCRIGVSSFVGIDTIILPAVNRAHTFLVEMPVTYQDVSIESVIRLHEIIQMEKPAHTSYCLRFLAERPPAELRGFFQIGDRSGIGVGHEVLEPFPEGSEPASEEPVAGMRPGDAPPTETIDEFIGWGKSRAPLPKAPRADDAPVEGREVRTSKAGGFDDAVREIDLGEVERLLRERGEATPTSELKASPGATPSGARPATAATLAAEPPAGEGKTGTTKTDKQGGGGGAAGGGNGNDKGGGPAGGSPKRKK